MGRGTGEGRTAASPRCGSGATISTDVHLPPRSADLSLIGCLIAGLGPPNAVNPRWGFTLPYPAGTEGHGAHTPRPQGSGPRKQGQPKDGKVEIAYWTFKDFEGQGIASFACQELVTIAHQIDPSLTITAKTAPENNASTKILANNNFIFAEIVQDDEIGDAWLWVNKGSTD